MITEDDLRAALTSKADQSPALHTAGLIRRAAINDRPETHRPLQLAAVSVAVLAVVGGTSLVSSFRPGHHHAAASKGQRAVTTAPTPQYVAQTLITALKAPSNTITNIAGHGGSNYASDTMTYNDGKGATLLYVTVAWPMSPGNTGTEIVPTACSQRSAVHSSPADIHWATEAQTCTTLADGTKLGVGQPRLSAAPGEKYGLALNNVSVLRPDGLEVSIGVFNQSTLPSPTGIPRHTTRAKLPFSTKVLTATAQNAQWAAQVPTAAVAKASTLFHTARPMTKKR